MKKSKKKLKLNRETVRNLLDDQLGGMAGGDHTNRHCTQLTCQTCQIRPLSECICV